MNPITIRRIVDGIPLTFKWHGGAYIEVIEKEREAVEVINVWDYKKDVPTIECSERGLVEVVDKWIASYDEGETVLALHRVAELETLIRQLTADQER